jgi:hypothetical protein
LVAPPRDDLNAGRSGRRVKHEVEGIGIFNRLRSLRSNFNSLLTSQVIDPREKFGCDNSRHFDTVRPLEVREHTRALDHALSLEATRRAQDQTEAV